MTVLHSLMLVRTTGFRTIQVQDITAVFEGFHPPEHPQRNILLNDFLLIHTTNGDIIKQAIRASTYRPGNVGVRQECIAT